MNQDPMFQSLCLRGAVNTTVVMGVIKVVMDRVGGKNQPQGIVILQKKTRECGKAQE